MNLFKSDKKYKEVYRYRFNRNYCDIAITGEEEFCDKLYSIISKIEFEIFGKDEKEVPVINDFSCGIDEKFSVNINGAKENVKKFLDIIKADQEYQKLLKGME